MKRARLFIIAAQILQAVMALVMVLLLSSKLGGKEFVLVSLSLGTVQLIAVLAYEWLRLGAMRWFPGPADETSMRLSSIVVAALISSGILVVVLLTVYRLGFLESALTPKTILPIAIAAIFQGVTDLLYILIRFAGEMIKAAILQILRVLILFGLTVSIAVLTEDGSSVLYGAALAHLVGFFLGALNFSSLKQLHLSAAKREIISSLARQGVPAAAASQIHFLVAYAIRIIGVIALGFGSAGAAGFLLALDIVQRPFPIVATLVTALFVPDLNRAYDARDTKKTKVVLRKIFGSLFGGGLLGAAALTTLFPAFALFAVDSEVRPHFLTYSAQLLAYFCLLLFVQSGVAVVLHLHKRTQLAVFYACLHLGTTALGYVIWRAIGAGWHAMLWMAVVALGVTFVFSMVHSKTLKNLPLDRQLVSTVCTAFVLNLILVSSAIDSYVMALISVTIFCFSGFSLFKQVGVFSQEDT